MKQANNFRIQPKVPEPFLPQELSLRPYRKIFLHVSPLRAQAFSSGTLPVQEFVVTIAIIKESKMKFMLLFECSSSKHKFTLVAMIYFLFKKICCKRFFIEAFFKWKTLSSFSSPYPSKMKTNTENLNCRHFGVGCFYRNLAYLVPRAFNKFARGLSLRTHFAAVSIQRISSTFGFSAILVPRATRLQA